MVDRAKMENGDGQVRCDHEDSDEEGNGDNGCNGMGTNIYRYRDNKKNTINRFIFSQPTSSCGSSRPSSS